MICRKCHFVDVDCVNEPRDHRVTEVGYATHHIGKVATKQNRKFYRKMLTNKENKKKLCPVIYNVLMGLSLDYSAHE